MRLSLGSCGVWRRNNKYTTKTTALSKSKGSDGIGVVSKTVSESFL